MKPQSMEEKISYRLFFMGFVGLVCTAVLCLFVFHKAFREPVLPWVPFLDRAAEFR